MNCTAEEALRIGHDLDAELVKFSLDIIRPRELYGSCMHPDVMRQMADRYDEFKRTIPLIEEFGMQIAIENHTDTFADEILWIVDKLNPPLHRYLCRYHESAPGYRKPVLCHGTYAAQGILLPFQ